MAADSSRTDESRVISCLGYHLTRQVLSEARSISLFAGKKQIDKADVDFAIKSLQEKNESNRPPKSFMMELAAAKNAQPLPPISKSFGLRLPNDRFCQLMPNFTFAPANLAPTENGNGLQGGDQGVGQLSRNGNTNAPTTAAAAAATFTPANVSSLLGKRPAQMDEDYD